MKLMRLKMLSILTSGWVKLSPLLLIYVTYIHTYVHTANATTGDNQDDDKDCDKTRRRRNQKFISWGRILSCPFRPFPPLSLALKWPLKSS